MTHLCVKTAQRPYRFRTTYIASFFKMLGNSCMGSGIILAVTLSQNNKMLKNYLLTAFRNFYRHRQYTLINVTGLSLSIACCMLILSYVRHERSFDTFHQKSDRLVRLWQKELYNGEEFICTTTPYSAGTEIKKAFPEVEDACRVYAFDPVIKVKNTSFTEKVRMVDSSFFRMFSFPMLEGDAVRPFSNPSSIVLTKSAAFRFFGNKKALSETVFLTLDNKEVPFTVTAIIEEAPANSSISYNCLISYHNSDYLISKGSYSSWSVVNAETYLLLKEGVQAETLQNKLPSLVKAHFGEEYKAGAFTFFLQPVTDIHLNKDLPQGIEPVSDPKYSFIVGSIGILLLMVASINFILLSVGRSFSRFREVGVRKVLGAEKKQLVQQFWGESLLITVAAAIAGLVLSVLLFHPFEELIGQKLLSPSDHITVLFFLAIIFFVAVLAGIYPAVILAGYNPVDALKNKSGRAGNRNWLQQSLVTLQLVISLALITGTLTIRKQLNYINGKDLGYNRDQLLVIETHQRTKEGFRTAEKLKEKLKQFYDERDLSVSFYSMVQTPWFELGFTNAQKKYKGFQYNSVDASFAEVLGLKIVDGRNFQQSNVADLRSGALVNEAFVKEYGLKDAVGQKLPGPFDHHIIGVVKDFHYMSLHTVIRPLVLSLAYDSLLHRAENISFAAAPDPRLTVRLKTGNVSSTLARIKASWDEVAPGQEFDFRFVDDNLQNLYKNEQRTSRMTGIMALVSILIACMGLFGLATLNVARRTREIGVRKVLGASVTAILRLLSRDIIALVSIATIVTIPLTSILLNAWLDNFMYRINVGWEVFLFSFFLTMVISVFTVSFQTVRAALSNPVKSLRVD